jgi:hypothetical protein
VRALAEFIMRGRMQASVVALLGSWFPLISPATVALVGLRRGAQDGMLILLWAVLPSLATLFVGDLGLLMTLFTLAGLLTTFAVALMLSSRFSWSQSLIGLVVLSSFFGLLLNVLTPDSIQTVVNLLAEKLEQVQAQADQAPAIMMPSLVFVIGLISYVIAINSVLSLLLARWWQATLYNPGGFQTEFHLLRLGPVQTLICIVAMVFCGLQGEDYQAWLSLMGLPLLLAGIALVHHVANIRNTGGQWLVLFYLMLLLFNPIILVLMAVAALDTWINFRTRIAAKDLDL